MRRAESVAVCCRLLVEKVGHCEEQMVCCREQTGPHSLRQHACCPRWAQRMSGSASVPAEWLRCAQKGGHSLGRACTPATRRPGEAQSL